MAAFVEGIKRYTSNQLASNTQGTMTIRGADLFIGGFTHLLIGQRLGITIQVLTEKHADTGQIGVVVHWCGDVAPTRQPSPATERVRGRVVEPQG